VRRRLQTAGEAQHFAGRRLGQLEAFLDGAKRDAGCRGIDFEPLANDAPSGREGKRREDLDREFLGSGVVRNFGMLRLPVRFFGAGDVGEFTHVFDCGFTELFSDGWQKPMANPVAKESDILIRRIFAPALVAFTQIFEQCGAAKG